MGNSSVLALGNHPVGTGWKVSFDDQASTTKTIKLNPYSLITNV